MEQRSDDWFSARLGKVTASRVADVIAKTKTGWGASRANYRAQLVAERLTGKREEGYANSAMQWGIDQEAAARDAYCFYQDVNVTEVGFIVHPHIDMAGASPDGLILDDAAISGMVEIKCPNTATHIDTLKTQTIPGKYVTQMMWQMACTGSAFCDYVSYDPRMPEDMQLFVKRLDRDEDAISEMEAAVIAFLEEVDADIAALTEIYRKG
jgi:putative phage-type endonuclease